MKSFFNGRDSVVTDAIDGFLMSSAGAGLCRLDGFPAVKVVLRADWDRRQVALVSGGGSGHEPAHAGFVGAGLLTAAVCGEVFASPSVDAVLAGILAVTGAAGCLLIVKNYTGDRLNFGLAAERARAMGHEVDMVIVGDDVALPGARQPRGIAGTLFVHKLAGAAAAAGRPLAEVKAVAEDAAAQTRSLGLALSSCTMPGGEPGGRLSVGEAELGLGIHGEPGAEVVPMASAGALMTLLADTLERALGDGSARLALLVNALGGVPPLELAVVTKALGDTALMRRVDYVMGPAPQMTALDMHGISLSVLTLNEERLRGLQAPAAPVAWIPPRRFARPVVRPMPDLGLSFAPPASADAGVRAMIDTATRLLREIAPAIDALDAKVGDGDTGTTFAGAAAAIAAKAYGLPLADGAALLRVIGDTLSRSAGGSSGVLLATFFAAASVSFAEVARWPDTFQAGLTRLKAYGGARCGDRTMIDALEPALDALSRGEGLREMALAARAGATATASMTRAGAGRSAAVRADALAGVVDPGAEVVARLFEALSA